METAPKNGTPVLLQLKDPLPQDDRPEWAGVVFVGFHPGINERGFDIGWSFAAPVGYGGLPDHCFMGWLPLPATAWTTAAINRRK